MEDAHDFYGRVVDMDGQPISGATVDYGWNDVRGSHEDHTTTDSAGVSELRITGQDVVVKE
jgi:protocatechuate 3,4-dioxygenase beta subunit